MLFGFISNKRNALTYSLYPFLMWRGFLFIPPGCEWPSHINYLFALLFAQHTKKPARYCPVQFWRMADNMMSGGAFCQVYTVVPVSWQEPSRRKWVKSREGKKKAAADKMGRNSNKAQMKKRWRWPTLFELHVVEYPSASQTLACSFTFFFFFFFFFFFRWMLSLTLRFSCCCSTCFLSHDNLWTLFFFLTLMRPRSQKSTDSRRWLWRCVAPLKTVAMPK